MIYLQGRVIKDGHSYKYEIRMDDLVFLIKQEILSDLDKPYTHHTSLNNGDESQKSPDLE